MRHSSRWCGMPEREADTEAERHLRHGISSYSRLFSRLGRIPAGTRRTWNQPAMKSPQKAPLPMCKQERSSLREEELALLFVDRLDDGDF